MNPWNHLTQKFNTNTSTGDFDSACNVHIVWPIFLNLLEDHFLGNKQKIVLDYGCGAGGFSHKLSTLGYSVIGVDSSDAMIQLAQTKTSNILFEVGESATVSAHSPVDAIVSLMVFQFVKNIEETFQHLTSILQPDGIFLFAVFNPLYVKRLLEAQMFFTNFDSIQQPTQGISAFNGNIKVPTFIRTAQEYEALARKNNLQKIFEATPLLTPEFIQQFPTDEPTDVPEYLILGFKKI